tara:strand:+ start:371 stop:589 length:219 start_codon:yes stop_codon:yes gene_type:complete
MASALTPEGTLSSSKTTLWGNALLLTNSTVSPLATVILLGCYGEREEEGGGQEGASQFLVVGFLDGIVGLDP